MLLIINRKDLRAGQHKANYVWKAAGVCRVMKRFVVLCAIALISKLSAKMVCRKNPVECKNRVFA